jgi:hypothetical protein
MIFLLLAALTLSHGHRRALGAVFLTGSILTKYLTLGALPFFLLADVADQPGKLRLPRPDRVSDRLWRGLVRTVPVSLAALVTAAALFAPYWVGPSTVERVLAVDNNYLASPAALTILLVPDSQHWLTIARWALLAGVYLWLILRQLRGTIGEQGATFEGLFIMVLCAPHFAGWYLAVLVALAPLVGDGWSMARAAAFSVAASLTVPLWAFVWPAHSATMALLTFHAIIVPLTFGPPLLVGALGAVAKRRRLARETGNVDDRAVERILESA